MGIHVNIAEAKARLSELVSAAVRGEDVILDRAGRPQVRLVAIATASEAERERIAEKRKAAFGMWKHLVKDADIVVPPSMTDEEIDERRERKFGPAA